MGASWGDLRIGPYEVLTMAVSGLAGEVGCVRGQALPCTEGAAGLSRRIFSKRKRPSGSLWGILLQQQLRSVFSPPGHLALPWGCGGHWAQILNTRGRVHTWDHRHRLGSMGTLGRPCTTTLKGESATQRNVRPQALGRVQIKEGPTHGHTHSPEEGEWLNL